MKDLKVLITGATGGLGNALASRLSALGADLLLVDRDARALEALSEDMRSSGFPEPGICPLDLSIAGASEFEQIASILEQEYGGLDVIIHCAASFPGLQPIEQVSGEQWLECMQVNVNAVWLLTIVCLPLLRQSGEGRVVLMQECAKQLESAYWGGYGVSKAALRGLGGILAQELEGAGVQVINFQPGPMRTQLRARAYLSEDPAGLQDPDRVAGRLIRELEVTA